MTIDTKKKKQLKEQLRDQFKSYLSSRGMRQTAGRFKILDKCVDQRVYFNIQGLYDDLRSDYSISLASVYQTIDLLCECNILRKHYLHENEASYEIAGATNLHLICLACGEVAVQEISDNEEDENLRVAAIIACGEYRQFIPTFISTNVYGTCSKCAAAAIAPVITPVLPQQLD